MTGFEWNVLAGVGVGIALGAGVAFSRHTRRRAQRPQLAVETKRRIDVVAIDEDPRSGARQWNSDIGERR